MTQDIDLEQHHLEEVKKQIHIDIEHQTKHIQPTRDFTERVINSLREKQIKQMHKSIEHPYFAQVTFSDNNQKECIEHAYIGRFGLFEPVTLTPIVIDWRAPMANLYYEDAFVQVPVIIDQRETLFFDVKQKRQYEIQHGRILRFFDSTQAAGINPLLLQRLEGRSKDRLTDIVETIQAEQNHIIRADATKPLVVQGAAGSGKTTIALHRLSFLAYRQKDRTVFDNFLVIAPNTVFLDYISNVLPDLGVDGVVQTTWEKWAVNLLPAKIRLENPFSKTAILFERKDKLSTDINTSTMILASRLRGEMATKTVLKKVLAQFLNHCLPDEDLVLSDQYKMSQEAIHKRFFEDLAHYPYVTRRERLLYFLKAWRDDCIAQATSTLEQGLRKGRYLAIQERVLAMKKKYEQRFQRYQAKIRKFDLFTFYRLVMSREKNIRFIALHAGYTIADNTIEELVQYFSHTKDTYEVDDLAALIYLTVTMHGLPAKCKYSHIVVDEAQDLMPFQLDCLRMATNHDTLSIFGDVAQSIYEHKGIYDWETIQNQVFNHQATMATLQQSYRSTVEIMTFALTVLRHSTLYKKITVTPVLRHGAIPNIIQSKNREEALQHVVATVRKLWHSGYDNIAIIDKTAALCRTLHQQLKKHHLDATLMTAKDDKYQTSLHIVPIYLSKGMEFDAVILFNPDIQNYDPKQETDIKLLYVAITRAIHRLTVIHYNNLSPLFTPCNDTALLPVLDSTRVFPSNLHDLHVP